ncbi:MAG: hypothetical protein WD231_03515 [Candidatus Woykebacteria bacterium]
MKFREVTWYSKLLALALFVALPFMGFCAGMKYQEGLYTGPTNNNIAIPDLPKKDASDSSKPKDDSNTDSRTQVKKINNDKLSISVILDDGKLTYTGTVKVPTPCHSVKHDALVAESYPEQVQIKLTTLNPDPTQVCAQVVANKKFSGEVQVSSKATISIYLDGNKID